MKTGAVNLMHEKSGASSVLIILMMIVLVVFGLAALTTTLAAQRLSEKAKVWTGEFYGLEAKVQVLLFDVDTVLHEAEAKAVEYIENNDFLKESGDLFSDDIQLLIYKNYTEILPDSVSEEYLGRVMKAVFCKSAVDSLLKTHPNATIGYNEGYLRQILEDEGFDGISFSITVSEEEGEFSKNLDISLVLNAPRYNIKLGDGSISGDRSASSGKRYSVTSWREWQEYFDYSDSMDYSDPSF